MYSPAKTDEPEPEMHSTVGQFQGDCSNDSRGTTRIVYTSGGSNDNFRNNNCHNFSNNGFVNGNQGNFQFNNNNNGFTHGKSFRQQMNGFRDNYGQRNFNHSQGMPNQARFVRIQGCKMRPQANYRNFIQQQKQKMNRGNRFNQNNMKHMHNNYNKSQRVYEMNPDNAAVVQRDVQDFIMQQRSVNQDGFDIRGHHQHHHEEKTRFSPVATCTPTATSSAGVVLEQAAPANSSGSSSKLFARPPEPAMIIENEKGHRNSVSKVQVKMECSQDSSGSYRTLSYEDVTENSNENSNSDENESLSDLRERLLWKKHCEQVVKREPGEIYSDEEEENPENDKALMEKFMPAPPTDVNTLKKKKSMGKQNRDDHDQAGKANSGISSSSGGSTGLTSAGAAQRQQRKRSSSSSGKEEKDEKKVPVPPGKEDLKKKGIGAVSHSGISHHHHHHHNYRTNYNSYSCHDDRYEDRQVSTDKGSARSPEVEKRKKECCGGGTVSSCNSPDSDKNVCYTSDEMMELSEKVHSLKRVLRETRDRLLESRVVGSKKAMRLKEEIDQLKKRLDDAGKREDDLKSKLKCVEHELTNKRLELAKMTTLHDVELREKEKFRADLTRTYQDRLTIEIDKLRALFDIEMAKMQAFYLNMSQNLCYDEGTGMGFVKAGSSDSDLRNHERLNAKIGDNLSHAVNGNGMEMECEMGSGGGLSTASSISFMQSYFDFPAPPSSGQCSSSSLYQNGMVPSSCLANHVGLARNHLSSPGPRILTPDRLTGNVDIGFGHIVNNAPMIPSKNASPVSNASLKQNHTDL